MAWGMVGEGNYIFWYNPVVLRFLTDLIIFF